MFGTADPGVAGFEPFWMRCQDVFYRGQAIRHIVTLIIGISIIVWMGWAQDTLSPSFPGRHRIQVVSSMDGSSQDSCLILPSGYVHLSSPIPLVVVLHTWSDDCEQRLSDWESEADQRGWFYLFPNFRGKNDKPEACGSTLAQMDILDAVQWVKRHYSVDSERIYLGGVSGGGHMTLLMVGCHPEVWTAASAWVGITDLRDWFQTHSGDKYGEMLCQCMGGIPGANKEVDRQYRARSPLTFLANGACVPVDLAAGRHDGHQGSVPITHSLRAFNEIAREVEPGSQISREEIEQLSQPDGHLVTPRFSDLVSDASLGREIFLRRTAGSSRITIFEGGHEGIASAAFNWFDGHPTR